MLHLRRAAPLLRRAPPPPRRLRPAALAPALGTDRQRWGLVAALALGGVGVGAAAGPTEAAFTSETATAARQGQARRVASARSNRCRAVGQVPRVDADAWAAADQLPWAEATESVWHHGQQVQLSGMRLDPDLALPVAEVVPRSDRLNAAIAALERRYTVTELADVIVQCCESLHKGEKACPSNAAQLAHTRSWSGVPSSAQSRLACLHSRHVSPSARKSVESAVYCGARS